VVLTKMPILNKIPRELLFWGAADQARVLKPIVESLGSSVVALVDDTPGLVSPFRNVEIYEGISGFNRWRDGRNVGQYGFVVAIGNPYGDVRCRLHDFLLENGLQAVSFADSTANIDESVIVGEGAQVMRGAIVNVDARLGKQCIINTRALVEHDCILEDGVEIGPGAVLCGRVHVGKNSWVAANATVRPRVTIGSNTIIGAGAVVVSDIPDDVVAVGVPARILRHNGE